MDLLHYTAQHVSKKPGALVETLGSRDELSRKLKPLFDFLSNEDHPQLWFPGPASFAPVMPSYHTVARALRENGLWEMRVPLPTIDGALRYADLCIRKRTAF